MAEWLGAGLQNLVQRFDSARYLGGTPLAGASCLGGRRFYDAKRTRVPGSGVHGLRGLWSYRWGLDVEAEVHDVAVHDHIVLALDGDFAGLAARGLRAQGHVIGILDDLRADEALLEV